MKMYPPRILTTLALAALLCSSVGAWAQGGATPSPSPEASASPAASPDKPMRRGGGGGGGMRGGNMLERLTKELDLTADQQTKIKAILDAQQEKMKADRGDKSASRDDMMKKRTEAREATNKQIEAVLTPEQKTKFEAMQAKMRERGGKNGGGGMQRGPGRGEDKAPATAPSPAASATP